jgi:GTP-binding protein
MRAQMSIERSDVCIIMIDAVDGVTEQDTKIAGYAHDNGKAAIIAINKWDLIEKETGTQAEYEKRVRQQLAYMPYAPVVFISAKTGQRVDNIFERINYVHNQSTMRISTGMLNDVLGEATMRTQPPTDKGKRLKIYYMTQISVAPPTFVIFCNNAELFHFSYQRYLENCLRETFGFTGTPIKLIIRERGEDNDK